MMMQLLAPFAPLSSSPLATRSGTFGATFCGSLWEIDTATHLRRLMSNCGPRRRSRELMLLVPNLLPKVVPHHGSRLLAGLIVRTRRGRLVAGRPPRPCSPTRRSSPWRSSPNGPASAASATSGASPPHTPARLLPEWLCTQGQFNRRVRALEPKLRAVQRTLA
jgi:hypothetical protein